MNRIQVMQQMLRDRGTARKPPKKVPLPSPHSGYGMVPYYAAQAGLGSPMQRGEGHAYRDGSLGMAVSFSEANIIMLTVGAIAGLLAVKQGYIKKGFLGT
jgi:hypothetical protein